MLKVGLTGDLASGKTFISKIFVEKGVPYYNCDENSKKLLVLDGDFNNRSYEFISYFGKSIILENQIKKNAEISQLKRYSSVFSKMKW